MACMADLAPGTSASNGKSSAGPGFPAPDLAPTTGVDFAGVATDFGDVAGAFALVPAEGLGAEGLEPGLAFIDEPQNGQSAASSSMTDSPHEGQTGKSMFANSSLRMLSGAAEFSIDVQGFDAAVVAEFQKSRGLKRIETGFYRENGRRDKRDREAERGWPPC